MSVKTILSVLYFTVSLSLIVWSEVVSKTHQEMALFGIGIFALITFPSSLILGKLSYYISSIIWTDGIPWYVFKLDHILILLAGYFQWFYFLPWLIKRMRAFYKV